MASHDHLREPNHEATREDVVMRFAASERQQYEYEIIDEDPLRIEVESDEQPAVEVVGGPDYSWCTCDEDTVPGTCSHVLFLAASNDEIAVRIQTELARDIEILGDELEELQRRLNTCRLEREAIDQALTIAGNPPSF